MGVALLAAMFAMTSAPAAEASTMDSLSRAAKAKRKKRLLKKRARAKAKRKALAAKRRSKHKLAQMAKAEISMTTDGHVTYGRNNMPTGWDWPPNAAMKAATKVCHDTLSASGLAWEPAPGEGKIAAPVTVPEMEIGGIKYVSVYKKPPFTMDCQLVLVLAGIGPSLHAIGVREVKFGSIYRNTAVRAHGQTRKILSRHALGLAMDIKQFVDASGRVADVELDYLKGDKLLHDIEDVINKSNKFRIVLTPGNDPISHYDHFHVEAAVDYSAFR